ncbi:MAG: transglutaminase-like domain-containing protein [Clostridiales Family XIII bacterium]|nr:transglutaminase-like domain-containing protein [Clostridiales Family XIII bacterium]
MDRNYVSRYGKTLRRMSRFILVVFTVYSLAGVTAFLPAPYGAVALALQTVPAKVDQKTGVSVFSNDKAAIDESNLAEGYVIIKYTGGKSIPIKVQITKKGGTGYTYNLNNKGTAEIFPLSEGDGEYTINVFENVSGSKYALAYGHTAQLKLRSGFLPFMYPNQYVSYTSGSQAVKQAGTLVTGKGTDLEKLDAIYHYVVSNLTYDYALAKNAPTGYVPNIDSVMSSKKGICFDYASLTSAMLRSQNIPSKLVIGYAGSAYHAWINVFIENVGWVDKAFYFDGDKFTLMDPTFASSGKSSPDIMKYIGDGKNYTVKTVH